MYLSRSTTQRACNCGGTMSFNSASSGLFFICNAEGNIINAVNQPICFKETPADGAERISCDCATVASIALERHFICCGTGVCVATTHSTWLPFETFHMPGPGCSSLMTNRSSIGGSAATAADPGRAVLPCATNAVMPSAANNKIDRTRKVIFPKTINIP